MKTSGLRWFVLAFTAVWIPAAASLWCAGMDASAREPRAPAQVFLGRLQQALVAFSHPSLRIRTSGQTVFFEAMDLPAGAGNLEFSGYVTVDPVDGALAGLLERFALRGGRIPLEMKAPTRIRCAPDGRVAIEGFEADGPSGRIAAAGSIAPEGALELAFRLTALDLRRFYPFREQALLETLDAELTLRGDWGSVFAAGDAAADIVLSQGRLRMGPDIPPVVSLHLRARLDRSRLLLQSCEGLLGEAPFRVTGRIENPLSLAADGWIDLAIAGDHLLLYRSDWMRVRAATALRLTGPFSRLHVGGALSITEGHYQGDIGLLEGLRGSAGRDPASSLELFSIRSQPLRDAQFDVAVSAAKPFEITNSRLRAVLHPNLKLNGSGEKPVLTGRVDFGPTTLYLPGGRMHFDGGAVRFEPPGPRRPQVELNGRGRLQGYDVHAVVEGPYDQPTVTLSSSPALSSEELLLLVLSGQAPASRRISDFERSRHLDVAVHLGKEMMARIEGPRSNDSVHSVMDRFDVEVGNSPSRSGDETVRVLFRVASDIFREGDTFYLAGEKDAFGYFNGGVRIAFRFR